MADRKAESGWIQMKISTREFFWLLTANLISKFRNTK